MTGKIRIKQNGDKVLLYINETTVEMPWQSALEIVTHLRSVAKLAEEYDKVERIIDDGAILLKAGWNIGLTDNKKMQDEIGKEAAWGKFNKYMGTGVKSQEIVGTPTVYHGRPDNKLNGGKIDGTT